VILDEVIHSRDIMEFDLKSFFPLVNLTKIYEILLEKGVPKGIASMLHLINCSGALIKPPHRLNEYEETLKRMLGKFTIEELLNKARPWSASAGLREVPQGANTSPILATLLLPNSVMDRGVKNLMYADDGLYYGNIDQPLITPNTGMVNNHIFFNLDKTRYIKRDGE
jgi:hypothetical protein